MIIVTLATEPEQKTLTSMKCSNPGIQWLLCGCFLRSVENGDCGNHFSPITDLNNDHAGEMIWLWGGVVAGTTQLLWL